MRKLLMAGVAAISLTIVPTVAIAQADVPGSTNSVDDKRPTDMNEEQQAMYDTWPADRQADYDTWAPEYQTYYWGLEPQYQEGYWALTPEQRTRIYGMAPEQQKAAWDSVAAQLRGEAPPQTSADGTSSGMESSSMGSSGTDASGMESSGMASSGMAGAGSTSASTMAPAGNTKYISNATVQGGMTTPTPQADYPVCKGEVQDSCINPGAK